jgi:hypothetical protein
MNKTDENARDEKGRIKKGHTLYRPKSQVTLLNIIDKQLKGVVTDDAGNKTEISGVEVLARRLVKGTNTTDDMNLLHNVLKEAQAEAREEKRLASQEQAIRERKLTAVAMKVELENEILKAREEQRAKKEDAETEIKRLKAEQEYIKTKAMTGEFVSAELMQFYFSFFQRAISDCFASIKKCSPEVKRLYKADKDKEAEKVLITELSILFGNAVKSLEAEIEKDANDKK